MPYDKLSELPKQVTDNLPKHAQEIYMKAYNSAYEQYKDPSKRKEKSSHEETAHKVAWSAVENQYEKNNNGHWVKK